MNYRMISRIISLILLVEAAFLLPGLFVSVAGGEHGAVLGFAITLGVIGVVSGVLAIWGRKAQRGFYSREGMVCVGMSWLVMSLIGCLPFFLSGAIPNYIDALFEIVSGFTTTGASILSNVEAMPRGLVLWRSTSHWIGGMGVLVFLLAIVPISGRNDGFTMHLLRAESPGPNVGKLVPRMRKTAMILYLIYIGLTIINLVFLLAGDMPVFDAFCTAFGTAGTGGFGIKNDSMASYSPYLQNVTTVFMALFGVNFTCYYLLLLRQFRSVLRDEELRLYVGVLLVASALITVNIRGLYDTVGESIRHAAFQVSSIMTTTGYSTTDFDLWPSFSKTLLLCLMTMGACAGSTGGGFKYIRVLLLLKALRRNIRQVLHPGRVDVVRVNGERMNERLLDSTNAFLAAYVTILMVSLLIVSLDGFPNTTNLSAVLSCFNNIGPGLELVGPMANFGCYSALSKLVLIVDMLAGRLEIFPILALFTKNAWTRWN